MGAVTFLEHGDHECVKGLCHAALGVLAATCVGYNLAACLHRAARDRRVHAHLVVNVIVYTALTVWEAQKTRQHYR